MTSALTIAPISPDDLIATVQETKLYCNCDVDTWDDLFEKWIKGATDALQQFTGLAFVPSNVTAVFNLSENEDYIQLPFANGAVLNGVDYMLVGGRIYTNEKKVSVSYTTGVTEEWMKIAVMMYVADLFTNRGENNSNYSKQNVGELAKQFCKGHITHGLLF